MSPKENLTSSKRPRAWIGPEDYIGALARKRTFRRARQTSGRTQPEAPRLLLSTLPFVALIGLLAVLVIAIMVIAFPGSQPQRRPDQPTPHQRGVADRGWFQEAQKEMHRR